MSNTGSSFGRGVWVAPWVGPNGEVVLAAITRDRRLAALQTVPIGGNHVAATDELWKRLEGDDPQPNLKLI